MTLENLCNGLPREVEESLSSADIESETDKEDNVTYICLTIPRGGEKV